MLTKLDVIPMNMKRAYGFTLIELVVTVVVAIVLLGIAIPSFRFMMANSRATTQSNSLYSALNYARSEAIGRKSTVTVCSKATADATTTVCGASGDWAHGWHVFVDGGTTGTVDGTDSVLKHWRPLPGAATVTTTDAYVGFDGDASKNTVTAGEVTFAMAEAGSTGNVSRCVRVAVIGSIRMHKITTTATCP